MSQSPVPLVHVRAPGKINLALAVGPLGDDGYHGLATVFQAVSLSEDLHAHAAREFSVAFTGPIDTAALVGDDTLVHRAARLVAAELSDADLARLGTARGDLPGIRIVIEKNVPIAGGMGGGSADAAATLLACNAVWGAGLDKERLWQLAAELGADVPFALQGGTALGLGRGDQLTPILGTGVFAWVLVLNEAGLSTPAVYAQLDRMRADGRLPEVAAPDVATELLAAIRDGDSQGLSAAMQNDMQAAAFALAPELAARADRLAQSPHALKVLVSGSGPTLAVLVESQASAEAFAAELRRDGQVAFVASGPVPGAHFVHDTPIEPR